MATCFHHPDRETGRTCTRCGRPACGECLHPAPVGSHCWECIKAARPPTAERIRRWNASSGALASTVLIALNAAVFVVTSASTSSGLRPTDLAVGAPPVADGEWYRLVTAGFVHYGLLHLAFNMLLLYRLGQLIERTLGRTRFVALYFAALLTGSFGALLVTPNAATGGASGAVFGLAGATAIGMRQRGINVWQSGIGPMIAINLVLTFAIPNISVGGHVGGLVGGAIVGSFMLRQPTNRKTVLEGVGFAALISLVAVAASLWIAANPLS